MRFNPSLYRYPSRRTVHYAARGMVCTSVPLAAQAGLEILKKGGNAIDAAIAAAMAITVTEPVCNGIGSDAFALVWTGGKLHGLNASGWSPAKMSADLLKSRGFDSVPRHGWEPVMTPGAPSGWATLNRSFGRLPLTEVAGPAIWYAEHGYPVSPDVAVQWAQLYDLYARVLKEERYAPWFETFAPKGRAPLAGELWGSADMARTLRDIAETGAESFYRGALMETIVAFSDKTGGYFDAEDFSEYAAQFVEPLTTGYKGYDVCEIPPNGHGIAALMALNILEGIPLGPTKESPETYHAMIEAMKLAYVDTKAFVADPRHMKTKVADMLNKGYAAKRRSLISENTALHPEAGRPADSDTIYLCTADGEGNMVSYIQSNYAHFGSGIVVPGTGIALQNRGNNFSMDSASDNCIAGRKKSYHTIIPGFLCKDGEAVGPFGVMGGFMQPQGHFQVIVNTVDYGMNPQECLDAPRFRWIEGKRVQIEAHTPIHIVRRLQELGHEVELTHNLGDVGRGEIIWRTEHGTLSGATEPRCDGTVASW